MTPKEQAKELVERFFNCPNPLYESYHDAYIDKPLAKQCALICVDEKIKFLKELENMAIYDNDTAFIIALELTEQTEVKQEINKL